MAGKNRTRQNTQTHPRHPHHPAAKCTRCQSPALQSCRFFTLPLLSPAATCRRPERPPQRADGRPLRSASGPSVGLLPVLLKDSALARRVRGRSCLVEELRPEADEGGCSQPGIQSRFLERHRHGGQRVLKARSDQARIRAESLQTRCRGSRRRRGDVSLLPETSGCAEARVCHPDPRCRGGIRRLACCSVEGARDGADRQGAGRKTAAASSSAARLGRENRGGDVAERALPQFPRRRNPNDTDCSWGSCETPRACALRRRRARRGPWKAKTSRSALSCVCPAPAPSSRGGGGAQALPFAAGALPRLLLRG